LIEIGQPAAGKHDGIFKILPAVSEGVADAVVHPFGGSAKR
jgi:hypothetical protein